MKEYLISKYNPQFRINGKYIRNEWSGESDIGKKFLDGILTQVEYDCTLDRYISCTMDILNSADIEYMTISDLEINVDQVPWKDHQTVKGDVLSLLIRDCLREKCWCRLLHGKAFVHFGYELYLYLGCDLSYEKIVEICTQYNLYVIERKSPYKSIE